MEDSLELSTMIYTMMFAYSTVGERYKQAIAKHLKEEDISDLMLYESVREVIFEKAFELVVQLAPGTHACQLMIKPPIDKYVDSLVRLVKKKQDAKLTGCSIR